MTDLGQFCNRAAVPFGRLRWRRCEMLIGLQNPAHIIGSAWVKSAALPG
jgi:hypothetical protein